MWAAKAPSLPRRPLRPRQAQLYAENGVLYGEPLKVLRGTLQRMTEAAWKLGTSHLKVLALHHRPLLVSP